jgi:GT2 family glycosyltransferase
MMSQARPLISVVVLSYDRPDYLREALRSLLEQTYENLEIIVVDNESKSSREIASVVGDFEGVRLIHNQHNLGYAGGMNRGLQSASGLYVYLTEDDIVLEADCISRLVQFVERHPSTGLAAPIMYNKKERTILCAGGEFELGAVYRKRVYGAGELDTGQFSHPFNVTYIDGAAMFACADLLKKLHGFREEFFMYVEAVELCARVIEQGRTLAVVPQAKVYHFEPPEGPTAPEIEFHKIKNFFSLYLLHAPARHLPEFVCRYAVFNTIRSILGGKGDTLILLKALLWVLRRTPSLLRERYQRQLSVSDSERAPVDQLQDETFYFPETLRHPSIK